MENNVVDFPKPTPVAPGSADPVVRKAQLREQARADVERARTNLNRRLTSDEAHRMAGILGDMIEEKSLRRAGGLARLAEKVAHSTFSKQRGRYVRFSDEPQETVARIGAHFASIAEAVGELSEPDDPRAGADTAVLRIAAGLSRQDRPKNSKDEDSDEVGEAFSRLHNLINLEISRIDDQLHLARYFRALDANDPDLDETGRFRAKHEFDGFSPTNIFDNAMFTEAGSRMPRYLPRVRIATVYRRHVATTVVVSDPVLSTEDKAGPQALYEAGLNSLGLRALSPEEGYAFPAAPTGWHEQPQGRLECLFERLDVWLAAIPSKSLGRVEAALLFVGGESAKDGKDIWGEEAVNREHANNPGIYYSSVGEGDDENVSGWPNSSQGSLVTAHPAVLYSREDAKGFMLPAAFYCGPDGPAAALVLRAQVPPKRRITWPQAEWSGLMRLFGPDLRPFLFQKCFYWCDNERDYNLASPTPDVLNDTPILIRRFVDPETWSPGPMKSLGAALLGNVLGQTHSSVFAALRASAALLVDAMDDFTLEGRVDFERRFRNRSAKTDHGETE